MTGVAGVSGVGGVGGSCAAVVAAWEAGAPVRGGWSAGAESRSVALLAAQSVACGGGPPASMHQTRRCSAGITCLGGEGAASPNANSICWTFRQKSLPDLAGAARTPQPQSRAQCLGAGLRYLTSAHYHASLSDAQMGVLRAQRHGWLEFASGRAR